MFDSEWEILHLIRPTINTMTKWPGDPLSYKGNRPARERFPRGGWGMSEDRLKAMNIPDAPAIYLLYSRCKELSFFYVGISVTGSLGTRLESHLEKLVGRCGGSTHPFPWRDQARARVARFAKEVGWNLESASIDKMDEGKWEKFLGDVRIRVEKVERNSSETDAEFEMRVKAQELQIAFGIEEKCRDLFKFALNSEVYAKRNCVSLDPKKIAQLCRDLNPE